MNKINFFGEFSNFDKFVLGALSQKSIIRNWVKGSFFVWGEGEGIRKRISDIGSYGFFSTENVKCENGSPKHFSCNKT